MTAAQIRGERQQKQVKLSSPKLDEGVTLQGNKPTAEEHEAMGPPTTLQLEKRLVNKKYIPCKCPPL